MMPAVTEDIVLAKISLLQTLFDSLPPSLPLSNTGIPCLDNDDIEDRGYVGALNRAFECTWGMKKDGLVVKHRGSALSATILLLRNSVPVAGSELPIVLLWIEALIDAARAAGSVDTLGRQSRPDGRANDVSNSASTHDKVVKHGIEPPPVAASLSRGRQTKLSFMPVDQATYDEQKHREFTKLRERSAYLRAREDIEVEKKAILRREYEAEKKRKQRFKAWAAKHSNSKSPVLIDLSDSDAIEDEFDPVKGYTRRQENALHSHNNPRTSTSKLCSTKDTSPSSTPAATNASTSRSPSESTVRSKAVTRRTNWQKFWFWKDILEAAASPCGFSAAGIEKYLWKKNPLWYRGKGGIYKQTIDKWIVKDADGRGLGWTEEVLRRAEQNARIGATRRSKTLDAYPVIVDSIKEQLIALRAIGIPVRLPLATAVIKAHILHKAPQLLHPESKFRMSQSWVHSFLQVQLSWSSRQGTRASRKVPANAEELCTKTFLRIVFAMQFHDIPPDFVVNPDQAGVQILPSGKTTFEVKGSRDVSIVNHEEKRQTTAVLASSMSGNILPFQTIWGGTTAASLPAATAPRRDEADALGFIYGHGDTRHWSSRETTKEWVLNVLDPYLAKQRILHNKPDNAKSILLLDVWPVHIAQKKSDDFLPWLKETHPNIIPIFVPGGCTGLFQPADVGLQRLMKHHVKRAATDFMVGVACRKLAAGARAKDVTIPTDLPTLRNASVGWFVDAYKFFESHPQIVRDAWSHCRVGPWSLTPECLQSDAAKKHLQAVIASDPAFAAEFTRFDFSVITGDLSESGAEGDMSFGAEHDDDLDLDTGSLADLVHTKSNTSSMVSAGPGSSTSSTSSAAAVTSSDDNIVINDSGDYRICNSSDLDDLETVVQPQDHLARPHLGSQSVGPHVEVTHPELEPSLQPGLNSHYAVVAPPEFGSAALPATQGPPTTANLQTAGPGTASGTTRMPPPVHIADHADPSLTTSTYLLGVAVTGGTNYAALQEDASLRTTNKKGKAKTAAKPRARAPKKSGNKPDTTGGGSGRKGKRKRTEGDETAAGAGSSEAPPLKIRIVPLATLRPP